MTKTICEDYYMYARIRERGAKIVFATGRSAGARARRLKLPTYENEDG
jgi:hydroxymethylpyrimidine pyrophosphatase-like HAD family hydrolase